MPQVTKGGKHIFGWSVLKSDLTLQLPTKAIEEYDITAEGKVILISGSKQTGGFVVTRRGLLENSKLGHILTDTPALRDYKLPEGGFVKYKGRLYCWLSVSNSGLLCFDEQILHALNIGVGDKFLSIRSSDIAFCMGAKGQLLKRAENYEGTIAVF